MAALTNPNRAPSTAMANGRNYTLYSFLAVFVTTQVGNYFPGNEQFLYAALGLLGYVYGFCGNVAKNVSAGAGGGVAAKLGKMISGWIA